MAERRWSSQFLVVLEALRMTDQLRAGRRMLRAGQVRELHISSSLAAAVVYDDNGDSYRTRIAVRAFSGADWRRIEAAIAQQAIHAARLLSGRVPDDLDRVVYELGLSLFPHDLEEVAMDCACPDWRVPCVHLTATWYALADAFDTDPFTILAWRGRSRDELLGRLRSLRVARPPVQPALESTVEPGLASMVEPPADPLVGFWSAGVRVPPLDTAPPARPDAILEQLDPLDLTVGRHQVTDLLRAAYEAL